MNLPSPETAAREFIGSWSAQIAYDVTETADLSAAIAALAEFITADRAAVRAETDARMASMEEALKPFAKSADIYPCLADDRIVSFVEQNHPRAKMATGRVRIGDLRRARAALVPPPPFHETGR